MEVRYNPEVMRKVRGGSFKWLLQQIKRMPGEKKWDIASDKAVAVREFYRLGQEERHGTKRTP